MERIVVGISGASGVQYGVRLLEVLKARDDIETHLVMTRSAEVILQHETDLTPETVHSLADRVYDCADVGAALASGSFLCRGMAIVPCSMKTLAMIALSLSDNLLVRAADVALKERRRLVLVPRETPLNLSHIRHMETVTQMGGVILPPMPSFYHRPATIRDIVDQTVGKVLDQLRIEHDLYRRWDPDQG